MRFKKSYEREKHKMIWHKPNSKLTDILFLIFKLIVNLDLDIFERMIFKSYNQKKF